MRQELLAYREADIYEAQAFQLADKLLEDIRDEEQGYSVVAQSTLGGASDDLVGGRVRKNLLVEDSAKLRAKCFSLYYSNPHVRSVVRNMVKFVFGKGATISLVSKSKAKKLKAFMLAQSQKAQQMKLQQAKLQQQMQMQQQQQPPQLQRRPMPGAPGFPPAKGAPIAIKEDLLHDDSASEEKGMDYWKRFAKKNKWQLKQKEMGVRGFRDGEAFLNLVEDDEDNVPSLIFREPDNIASKQISENLTFGIETDPDNVEKVISYHHLKNTTAGGEDVIPEAEMVHIKFCVDSNVKRGRSMLEPVIPYIVKYDQWIDDRMILNKVRNAIAIVKTITGSRSTLSSVRDAGKTTSPTGRTKNSQKMLKPGTVLTATPGVEYKMLSANINASDVANDGHNLLLCIAAGSGLPEMFLVGDFSNSNYASSLTAQNPLVREFEDYRDTYKEYIVELVSKLLAMGVESGELSQEDVDDLDIEVKWDQLIYKNLFEVVKACNTLLSDQVISRETYASEAGFDYKDERDKIRSEEAQDVVAPSDRAKPATETPDPTVGKKAKPPVKDEIGT